MIADRISRETGVSAGLVRTIVRTANKRYRTYEIDKRDGGKRVISQPSKKLKFVQRWLANRVLTKFPVHDAAKAYVKGRGIADNARAHVDSRYLLKIDFRNFFPSISSEDVTSYLRSNAHFVGNLSEADIEFIAQAVSFNGALTIGAPSSPMISNLVMYPFDQQVFEYCEGNNLAYTRYADDLAISSNEHSALKGALDFVKKCLEAQESPKLEINPGKTKFVSKKHKRFVTGLVLTTDNKISIGRDKKRELRTLMYLFVNTQLDVEKIDYLKGWLSYANAVEPSFNEALKKKYGSDSFKKLLEYDR